MRYLIKVKKSSPLQVVREKNGCSVSHKTSSFQYPNNAFNPSQAQNPKLQDVFVVVLVVMDLCANRPALPKYIEAR